VVKDVRLCTSASPLRGIRFVRLPPFSLSYFPPASNDLQGFPTLS